MTATAHHDLSSLPAREARLGALFARPKMLAVACITTLTALGWLALGILHARMSLFAALCGPLATSLSDTGGFALVASMWAAMTLAMMLPSAAPMIFTYAQIADTAARKGERIVSPFTLTGGYALVWLGFAAFAALAQTILTRTGLLENAMVPASGLVSGALFIAAGLYQFSTFKHACLTQCRSPFPFFFTNWATTPRGVFHLGVRQGLYCLGCCWAMMLLMFAVGTMNVLWMAALGIVMTIEKIGAGKRLSYSIGAVLVAGGVAFIASAFAAHWPLQVI